MNREELLVAIAAWIDQAADVTSPDKSLLIEKTGFVRSKLTGQIEQAEFTIRITSNAAQALVPVPRIQTTPEAREIIQS